MIKVVFLFLIYVTNINNIVFSPKRTHCRYEIIITTRICKMGVKSETKIITISTNFSFVLYDNDEGIFNNFTY